MPDTASKNHTNLIESVVGSCAKRADAYELYVSDSNSVNVSWDKSKLKDVQQKGSSGAGLRVAKGGTLGFAVSTRLDEPESLVDSALRLAPYGGPYDFEFAHYGDATCSEQFDPKLTDVSPDQLLSMGARAREAILAQAPGASFVGGVSVTTAQSWLRTSNGQLISERGSGMSCYVGAELNVEGDFLTTYAGRSANRLLSNADVDAVVAEAVELFTDARKSAPCPAGKYRVLITPECLDDFLTPIGANINGINVEKKTSRWLESRGQQVFDERITITDDPSLADGIGSSAFDGEGTPTRRNVIIERGVLKSFMHTLATAAHTGDQPTGNGARSVSSTAKPSSHNIVMEAGDTPLAELRKLADGGIWLHSLIGVFTSNFLAGQVSGNVMLGYRMEGGERVGRIKNAALNVNLFDLFNGQIVGISQERKWNGCNYLPWVLVEGVSVVSK